MKNLKIILKGETFNFLKSGYCASEIEKVVAGNDMLAEYVETVDAINTNCVCGTFFESDLTLVRNIEPLNVVAITSTSILPLDGSYEIHKLAEVPKLDGLKHYIGHPATANIIEKLGAVKSETKLFKGLEIGESQLTFAIKQGMSDRSNGGTAINQDVTIDMLEVRVITRLK